MAPVTVGRGGDHSHRGGGANNGGRVFGCKCWYSPVWDLSKISALGPLGVSAAGAWNKAEPLGTPGTRADALQGCRAGPYSRPRRTPRRHPARRASNTQIVVYSRHHDDALHQGVLLRFDPRLETPAIRRYYYHNYHCHYHYCGSPAQARLAQPARAGPRPEAGTRSSPYVASRAAARAVCCVSWARAAQHVIVMLLSCCVMSCHLTCRAMPFHSFVIL